MRKELYKKEISKDYYENLYEKDYMDDWSKEKKERVFNLIKSLNLSETGTALDFGCGNGIFTNIIKLALPNWQVYGCDLSANSINKAKLRFEECNFFVTDIDENPKIKFDFLFSHHVLEHVFDIEKTIREINDFLKPNSNVLHILPCGNEDSFEYKICKMKTDGINSEMENRFFFEDPGHVRRLTTIRLHELMSKYGFVLKSDLYSNQYYGAIRWITQTKPLFILKFTNPNNAIDSEKSAYLKRLRIKLIILNFLQLPATSFKYVNKIWNKKLHHYLLLIIGFIPFLFTYPIFNYMNSLAIKEWDNCNTMKNGSEMYLHFTRE